MIQHFSQTVLPQNSVSDVIVISLAEWRKILRK